jgi:hypothetical protein
VRRQVELDEEVGHGLGCIIYLAVERVSSSVSLLRLEIGNQVVELER